MCECVSVSVSVSVSESESERESECCAATPPFGPPGIPSSPVCVCERERERMLDGFKIYVLIDCIESLRRKRRVLSCDATGWQIFSFLFRTRCVYYYGKSKKTNLLSRHVSRKHDRPAGKR